MDYLTSPCCSLSAHFGLTIWFVMDANVRLLIIKRNFTFFGKMIASIGFCFHGFDLKAYMTELSFYSNFILKNPCFLETLFLLILINLSLMFALHHLVFYFLEVIMTLNLYDCYLNLYFYLLLIVLSHLISQKEYLYLK